MCGGVRKGRKCHPGMGLFMTSGLSVQCHPAEHPTFLEAFLSEAWMNCLMRVSIANESDQVT